MECQINEISPVLVEVSVQVPWDRVRKNLDAGYRELSKSAKVRGFRPGKVPPHMVKQLFGKQVIAEVTSQLVEAGLMHAVEQHSLQVVAEPEVDPVPITDGKPFEFKAKVEVRPRLDQVDLTKLVVYQAPTAVDDAEVAEEIQSMRKAYADLREPEPMRGAAPGDELTIDYSVEVDGQLLEELGATERKVDLDGESILEELAAGLTGMKPDEDKDISVPFADDHPNERLKGKTATFHVKLLALRERILPDEDDEFAQDCGDFKTLDDLRADVRERLTKRKSEQQEAKLKEQLIDSLLASNDVPVPPSLVKQQEKQMVYEMATFAQMLGRQLDPSDLEGLSERALRRVRAGLLLGAVARLEKLEVTDEHVEEKLHEIAARTGKHIAKVRVEYAGERRERLENEVLEEKLMAFLRTKATIQEGEPPPAEEKSE